MASEFDRLRSVTTLVADTGDALRRFRPTSRNLGAHRELLSARLEGAADPLAAPLSQDMG